MIALGRDIGMFRATIDAAVRGDPDALLVVEFAEDDQAENVKRLKQLVELMADLGFGWDKPRRHWGGVVEVVDPALQASIADFRAGRPQCDDVDEAGRQAGSFIEDLRCRLTTSPITRSG